MADVVIERDQPGLGLRGQVYEVLGVSRLCRARCEWGIPGRLLKAVGGPGLAVRVLRAGWAEIKDKGGAQLLEGSC